MSIIVPPSGAIAAAVHVDIRAAFGQYLAAFKAAEPFRDILQTIKRHPFATQCDVNGGLIALHSANKPDEQKIAIRDAIAIREALRGGSLARSWEAKEALDELMQPPAEEIIRAMLAAMLKIMRAKPGEGGPVYIDGLVWEIMEPEFSGPAIAAACRETWQTQTFAPAPCELIPRIKQHQERVELARAELTWITNAWLAATEVLDTLAQEKLLKHPLDEDDLEF
jgi:hypothetical protein